MVRPDPGAARVVTNAAISAVGQGLVALLESPSRSPSSRTRSSPSSRWAAPSPEAGGRARPLLLDKVDARPLANQVKLLRLIQQKEYRPLGTPGCTAPTCASSPHPTRTCPRRRRRGTSGSTCSSACGEGLGWRWKTAAVHECMHTEEDHSSRPQFMGQPYVLAILHTGACGLPTQATQRNTRERRPAAPNHIHILEYEPLEPVRNPRGALAPPRRRNRNEDAAHQGAFLER